MNAHMTRLEKIALTSAAAGAIFNVFLFGIGSTLADATTGPLFYARAVAAVLQAAAFDLVAIATVSGMYRGRRSHWSMLTAVTAAAVSILIALDVAGVWHQPWLHAANALIVLVFTLHLLAPAKSSRAREYRQLVKRLVSRLRQERQVAEYNLSNVRTASEQAVSRLEQERNSLEQMLATARQELSTRPPALTVEVIRLARYELTWDQTEQLARMILTKQSGSLSSVRRYVAQLADKETV